MLLRRVPLPSPRSTENLDAVLISHLHLDHADRLSLNMLPAGTVVLAPVGTRSLLRGKRFPDVREMSPGDSVRVGSLQITATPAKHEGRRYPWNKNTDALGYLISGSHKLFFAGDTGLFPGLADISEDLDVVLLPVWGWGLHLREDHLSPESAARALQLLKPRFAIPIHWGTLLPMGTFRRYRHFLLDPPRAFVHYAGMLAPDVRTVVLQPGEWARISDRHLVSEEARL